MIMTVLRLKEATKTFYWDDQSSPKKSEQINDHRQLLLTFADNVPSLIYNVSGYRAGLSQDVYTNRLSRLKELFCPF